GPADLGAGEDRPAHGRPQPGRPGGRACLRGSRGEDHDVPPRTAGTSAGGATMSAPRLDVAFVTAALGSRLRRPAGQQVVHTTAFTRAIIDSREAAPGDLFVALP